LALQSQRELDGIDGIDAKIIGQLGGRCHRLRGQPEPLDEESDDPIGGDRVVHHAGPPVLRSLFRSHASSLLRTRLALTPPKPKEFDTATPILRWRAWFGT